MSIAWLLMVSMTAASAAPAEPAKSPVPEAAAQSRALALIKDVFKADYAAKAPEKRQALGRNLLKQGLETGSDPAARFVLFREAEDVAAGAGDIETALKAANELVAGYRVDPEAEKTPLLNRLIPFVKSPETAKAVADEASALADLAWAADGFDRATALLGVAEKAAIKGKDIAGAAAVRKRKEAVAAAKARFARVAKFAETLQVKPDDPEANLEIGRFDCFVKGDWKSGLPRLAKGSDAAIKALAEKSLKAGEDAAALAEVAGGWWTVGDGLAGAEREAVREYAADRYRAALPNLTGFAKVVAEKRIAEAGKPAATLHPARRTVDLIALVDVSKDALGGTWKVDKGTLRCETGNFVPKMQIPYQPPEEYDFSVTFSQPGLRNGISLVMPDRHGGSFYWAVAGGGGSDFWMPYGKAGKLPPATAIKANTVHTTLVQVRKDGLKAFLDGKLLAEVKTDFKDFKSDGWHDLKDKTLLAVACDDPSVFSAVQVTEVSGPGKRIR